MKQPKSFEEGMDRLQGLLTQLQESATPLADSVKLYAEAAGLIHYCNTALDKARLQVEDSLLCWAASLHSRKRIRHRLSS